METLRGIVLFLVMGAAAVGLWWVLFVGGIALVRRFPVVGYVLGALLALAWLVSLGDPAPRDCSDVAGGRGGSITCE